MITLYGHAFSRAHRVLWMLKELGLPFAHVPTSFLDGSTRTPEFLAINPNGRVPVLDDDGLVLFESMAINLHLARRYPSGLSAAGGAEEALATQWSFWAVAEVEKPLLLAAANLALFPPDARVPAEAALMLGKLARPFGVLDRHLAGREQLLGDRFTVADLNVAALLSLAPIAGVSLHAWPALAAWLDRCLERPAAADWKPIRFTVPRPADMAGMLAMFV